MGSLALSLGEVLSVRQRVVTGNAARAVQAISALLQERDMGHEELLHQISEYATAAVTPKNADSYGKSFKVWRLTSKPILKEDHKGPGCDIRQARVAFQGRAGCQRGSEFGEDNCCRQRQVLV